MSTGSNRCAVLGTLTDIEIRAWMKAPSKAVCDGDGLWLTPKASGDPVWILRYRWGGKRKEYTIGRHSLVGGLSGARKEAIQLRSRVVSGEDIGLAKQLAKHERRAAKTYAELLDDYLEHKRGDLSPITVAEIGRMQKKDIIPVWGKRLAADIAPLDVVEVLRKIKKRSYSVAKRLWEQLTVIFAHGTTAAILKASPCASLKASAVLGSAPLKKSRIKLSRETLRLVMMRLPEQGRVNALAVKILLYSCVRKSELLTARKENVRLDDGIWHVPAEAMGNKARRAYDIPLAPLAIRWFRELLDLSGDSEWVLPPQANRVQRSSETMSRSTLNAVLGRLGEDIHHFAPHDIRATARSYLGEIESNQLVIERALNHSLGGLIEIYDRGDYLEERRAMLEHWAVLLEQYEKGLEPQRIQRVAAVRS